MTRIRKPSPPAANESSASPQLTPASNPRLTNWMPQTDAATVALARDGDSEAFRALVDRHSRAVYRLAYRMTGSAQDAEDVVQETFLKAYRQLGRFESRANFSTWLHRIAVNCSIDLMRARPHREAGHDAADLDQLGNDDETRRQASPERLMLSTEVQDRVAGAMSSLSMMTEFPIRISAWMTLSSGPRARVTSSAPSAFLYHSIARAAFCIVSCGVTV